jgi:hypothetical protein
MRTERMIIKNSGNIKEEMEEMNTEEEEEAAEEEDQAEEEEETGMKREVETQVGEDKVMITEAEEQTVTGMIQEEEGQEGAEEQGAKRKHK